ncbi:MAG: alpha-glucosidase family protein [Gammaproteobacteria bacterium]|nr:alpha-glucosidase family protein [Gammaproteobacteria bacterium]
MNSVVKNTSFSNASNIAEFEKAEDWWRGAVIYQIYPRSYQDSNGDGIGDLPGITQRLPYIANLGVDAVWISPFFKSPMLDFGYDVSDYTAVDPIFGSMEDFDQLIAKAHELGIKVMIDQVISHSSDQHAWFLESQTSKENPKSDWYVWADAKPDGSPPNNWLSIFGGSAWQWHTTRRQYYLHNFLSSQPDLNFHSTEVQDALLDTVRFWLDRGVDGFRLDTINFYVHDERLRDNPPVPIDQRNSDIAPDVNPYNYQDHLYDKNQPENLEFLKRLRLLLNEYGAAAVGEVGDAQYGQQLVSQYTADNDKVQMCYSFDFLSEKPLNPDRVKKVVSSFEESATDGWSCWAFSNHDVARHASRWAATVEERNRYLKMLATLIMSLRGSICLYQGEELGLTEGTISFEDLQDPYGIEFWPDFKGRDGCRTPMVWNSKDSMGGFTTGTPWLPVQKDHLHRAVDTQEHSADSLLEHYRAFLNFRKKHDALIKGNIQFQSAPEGVLMFERSYNGQTLLVTINMNGHSVEFDLPKKISLLENHTYGATLSGSTLSFDAFGALIAQVNSLDS